MLLLAREMGVLKMGTVALDGTKIYANASRHSALGLRRPSLRRSHMLVRRRVSRGAGREGYFNLCPNVEFFGAPPFDGAMTARLWAPTSQIVKLPPALSPLDAAMLEPLGVAIHAVDLAKPRLLERVAVLGLGPMGVLILQVLKVAGGGEICVVEPQAHRREMAMRLGAAAVGESIADIAGWSEGKGFSPTSRGWSASLPRATRSQRRWSMA